MAVSIVPSSDTGDATYQVLDDLGKHGHVWPELTDDEANEQTIIQWIIDGQFKRPLHIVAFDIGGGWARDVTDEIAWKILQMNRRGTPLSAAAADFVERIIGESPVVAV
jgi:hypothetical protein